MRKTVFLILVILISYSFITPGGGPIKWKFNKFKRLTFAYSQVMSMNSGFSFGKDSLNMFNKLEGNLVIKVKTDSLADIILTDLKMTIYNVGPSGDTSVMMTQPAPDMFIQDLKEDGTIDGRLDEQTELLANMLFPVVNKNMPPGDSTDLPMSVPFNLFGSTINVRGYNRVKCVGNQNGLMQLETIINVSEYTIPDEVKTRYKCYMKGNSKFEFNAERGYFTNGFVDINMAFGTESPDSSRSIMNMSMDMRSQIVLKLINVQ
jgi:hypothetical protein